MSNKMFNLVLCITLLASLIGLIPTTVVQAATPQPETTAYPYTTDHLIVKLRAEARVEKGTTSTHIASLDRALAEMNATALEAVPGLPATYLVKLDSKSADILGAVDTLNNDPAVEYAEPDYLAKFASAPDDPRYSEQWGLAKVQAEGAWDETMGSPNVVIAIIDSGIDLAHEDLAPNLWLNPGEIAGNSLDDDNNGFVDDVQGWNFVNATNDVQDFIGHGSLVAGVAAARTNNTLGIAGMCGNCRIMPVKITQVSGFANYSDIAAGVNYAADKGAKVINLSVGGYADSITVKNAINNALSKNIVVVGGVGNDNKSDPFYPAAYEGVIAVAGTDVADVRVTSSNYGTWVDISAPGQNILSTTLGDYSSDTGTSYATPFVSGAAGLLLSLHPEWTPAMVRSQFLHTTDSIDSANPSFAGMLGSGRLNAALATQPSHPILTYKTYTGNGTPEFRPDFGSTVSLSVTLYNDWADAAGVTGTLSSSDPYVTITTADADFGTLLAGASQANTIPFSFDIAAGAGYNHAMPFTLALSADDGGYTTTLSFTITTRSSEEPVTGTIDADTTWTNDKTYKVTGNVGVAPGYTLTIEPGTVVKFAGNYSLNLGGTLIAQGTAAQKIRFESYTTGGTWNRIFLDDTSLDAVTDAEGVYQSGNILQYVTITGATGGIACTTATPYLEHVTSDRGGLNCTLGGSPLWLQNSNLTGSVTVTARDSLVGAFDTPGEAQNVVIDKGYAYVADGTSGLRVVDVSILSVPIEIGAYDTPGSASDVAVSGNYAYVADGSALRVVDVSDPAHPVEIGFYEPPIGSIQKVIISGMYAYVSNTSGGIHILDISNPAAPVEIGLIPTLDVLTNVAVSGSYAYVADHESGLRIFDVSDPINPIEIGFYQSLYDRPVGVTVSGEYAYVISQYIDENGNSGPGSLVVVNVSNPTAPFATFGTGFPGDPSVVVVSGGYAYVTVAGSLFVSDLSDPAHLVINGPVLFETLWGVYGLSIADGYVYTAELSQGLRIYPAYGANEVSVVNTTLQGAVNLPQSSSVLDSKIHGDFSAGGDSIVQGSMIDGGIGINGDGQVSNTISGPLMINGAGDVQQATVTGDVSIGSGQVLNTTVKSGSISAGANSTISDCDLSGGGISAGAGSAITRNNIGSAPGNGITTSGNSTVTFNRIVGAGLGIAASAGTVENNLIANTTGDGLRPGAASVRNNTLIGIAGNGVYLNAVPAAFEYNNFEFNTGTFDVYVTVPKTTAINLLTQNNWWGTTDSNLIKTRTYDYYDDYNLAKLITAPVLTDPSQTAPGYVRSVTLNPASPVGIQTVNFTVEFSRPMDMDNNPGVSALRTNANTWVLKNQMPCDDAPQGRAVYATNGKIYLIGGSESGCSGLVEEFNPETDTWVQKSSSAPWDIQVAAAASNGKIYAMTNTLLYEYDPLIDSWSEKGSLPYSFRIIVGSANGKVYAMYGKILEEYDPYTNVWERKSDAPFSPSVAANLDNQIYGMVFGGFGSYLIQYNTLTDTWTGKAYWPVLRYDYGLVAANNGKLYVIGGVFPCDGIDCMEDYGVGGVDEYSPLNNTWTTQAGFSAWRLKPGLVAGNDRKIYIIGGTDLAFSPFRDVEEFTLPDYGYSNINSNPEWLDAQHYRASYDFTTLNPRGDYRLTVENIAGSDGLVIPPHTRTIFSVDYAGEISDTTPPAAPLVSAWGNGNLTLLSAQASASDPDSEIVGYRYAIGTTPGGSDVVNWTNTSYTEVTRSGLILQPDQAYYVSFQARNLGGLWSPIGSSNPVVNGQMPIPTPTIVSLNPASAIAGGAAFTLTVTGINFVSNSVVRWNGSNRATTFVSTTQLTAQIPAADIATASDYLVTVYTPAPGGGTSNALNFSVAVPNSPPVAVDDSYTTDEDTELTIDAPGVLGNDTDSDSDSLTAVKVTDPAHGTLTLNANGSFTYTPAANWNGVDSFTYKANDGMTDSNVATVTLNVTAVNDVPVANAQSVSTSEDIDKDVTLTATDPDDITFTWTIVTPPTHGALSGTAPNVIYTPAANYSGTDSFTFKVYDGDVDSNIATVAITVTAVNDVPVANAQSVSTAEDTAKAITLTATDPDDATFTWTIVATPTHGALSGTAPNVTYTPAANYSGADSFTFKVNDGDADSNIATVTLTVTTVNDVPVANAQSVSTAEDTAKAITLTAADPDYTSFTWTIVTPPAHGALSGTAPNVTYTPTANYNGADSFTFKVNDGDADSNIATVSIDVTAVNDVPVAIDQSVSTAEDTAKAITLTATDLDDTTFTWAIVTPPAYGTLSGTAPNVTYTPAANYNGADSFTFKVNDGDVDSNIATVSINVTAVNDVPVANPQSVSTSEDAAKAITLTATAPDDTTFTWTIVDAPAHGSLSGTAPNLTYTPATNYNGADSFTFKVNDGDADSNTATVSINVTAVNDVPVAIDQSVSTAEDTAKAITLTAIDPDDDAFTWTIVTPPTYGALSGTAPNVTYTPVANYSGADSFSFKVNDGDVDSNIATVSITVTAVNNVPVADTQSVSTPEDTAKGITLTATDPDDTIFTWTIVTAPSHGSLSGTAPDVTYTPVANYNGADSFTFKVNDGDVDSNIATVSINVTAVNDAPIAVDDGYSMDEDTVLSIAAPGVLGNDTDADSDPLTAVLVTGPAHGVLTLNPDGSFTYTPDANWYGAETFTYMSNDGIEDSNVATVTITVVDVPETRSIYLPLIYR